MIMKKIIPQTIILTTALLISSCGSKNEKTNQPTSTATIENNQKQTTSFQKQEPENTSTTLKVPLDNFKGQSKYFTKAEFDYFHFGLPDFSFGWKTDVDTTSNLKYSFHEGNPGTFLTKTFIFKDIDRAFIIFANVQSDEAEKGMNVLLNELKKQFGR